MQLLRRLSGSLVASSATPGDSRAMSRMSTIASDEHASQGSGPRRASLGGIGVLAPEVPSEEGHGMDKKKIVVVRRVVNVRENMHHCYHPGHWRHVSNSEPQQWTCCYSRHKDAKGCKVRPQLPPAGKPHSAAKS